MGLKQLIQTHLAASWRNSRRLASWPHSWVPWSFPLSLGSYVILRGMLPSFRGHAHCCWDLSEIHEKESSSRTLFSLVLSQSQETLGREDFFSQKLGKIHIWTLQVAESCWFLCRGATPGLVLGGIVCLCRCY